MKSYSAGQHAWIKDEWCATVYTYRKDQDGVQSRARVRLEPKDSSREGDLLRLPEHIEPDTDDDDDGDIESDGGGLHREGEEQGDDPEKRSRPRNESVDSAADHGRHRDTEHAYQAK